MQPDQQEKEEKAFSIMKRVKNNNTINIRTQEAINQAGNESKNPIVPIASEHLNDSAQGLDESNDQRSETDTSDRGGARTLKTGPCG